MTADAARRGGYPDATAEPPGAHPGPPIVPVRAATPLVPPTVPRDARAILCPGVSVRRAQTPADLEAARRLHAEVYLARGYVEASDLVDGHIGSHLDPWVESSAYFLATDPDDVPVAVCRQISTARPDQLPTLSFAGLDRTVAAQVCRQGPGAVVEISALAVPPGAPSGAALLLYAGMWQHSWQQAHTAWIMSVHPVVWGHLNSSLGPVLEAFGPPHWYLGSNVIPAVLWTDTTAATIARHVTTLPSSRRALTRLFPTNPATRRP